MTATPWAGRRLHFIAIGGAGMSGLAAVAQRLGATVTGSDRAASAPLERLRALGLAVLCPGHGPVVEDPAAKLDAYLAHRRERERRLVAALGDGVRTAADLLDRVWDDVPAVLRPAAAVTLAAHLDKLSEEGRLPAGIERPAGFG